MRIRKSIDVNASATDAWTLLADGFGDIGAWTTALDGSYLVGDRVEIGAERHCEVSGPISGDGLTLERVTAFDPDTMTYTYEAVRGLPGFIRSARNTLSVSPLAGGRCSIQADGHIAMRWWLVPLSPVAALALGSAYRKFFVDLRYRLELGAPHPAAAGRSRRHR
jgi:hypothetical protein